MDLHESWKPSKDEAHCALCLSEADRYAMQCGRCAEPFTGAGRPNLQSGPAPTLDLIH